MGKEKSFKNHLKPEQKFHSCILRITLESLHNSGNTGEASIQTFRENIATSMISSTRGMLVEITVQEWRSCFFTQQLSHIPTSAPTIASAVFKSTPTSWPDYECSAWTLNSVSLGIMRMHQQMLELPFTLDLYLIRVSAIGTSTATAPGTIHLSSIPFSTALQAISYCTFDLNECVLIWSFDQ